MVKGIKKPKSRDISGLLNKPASDKIMRGGNAGKGGKRC